MTTILNAGHIWNLASRNTGLRIIDFSELVKTLP